MTDETTVAELAELVRRTAAAMREVGDVDEADRVAAVVTADGRAWMGTVSGERHKVPSMRKALTFDPEFEEGEDA